MSSPNYSLLLLAAIQDDVATILQSNEYRTDIGTQVDLERVSEREDIVRCSLRIEQMAKQEIATSVRHRTYQIAVEAHVPASLGIDAEQLAHDALEDLLDCFPATTQYALGAGVTADVSFSAGRVLTAPAGVAATVAQAVLDAQLKETL